MITFPFTENGVVPWHSTLIGFVTQGGVRKWLDCYEKGGLSEWLDSHNVIVEGATITFPDEETKVLFIMRWM
jgi:hypothetical protein